jgi:hypothetical protein
MRISDLSRFPHPVLSPYTGDFTSGEFDVQLRASEVPETGALGLEYEISLTEQSVQNLVETSQAAVGCFVRCSDTYFTELRRMSWPKGRLDFQAGSLLNRVSLRPLVWLESTLEQWDPGTIHQEFSPPVSLDRGDILAIADEFIINVGQAKLAAIESIFELVSSLDVLPDQIKIDLDRDRIAILVAPKMYETLGLLRGQVQGRHVMMNAVYLPAVMDVLDSLRGGTTQYESFRWYNPFMARCDRHGIEPSPGISIFESAQKLLDMPASALSALVQEVQ